MSDLVLEDVKRLRLNPGDVLVVRLSHEPSTAQVERLREALRSIFPNNEAVILGPGAELEVVEGGGAA